MPHPQSKTIADYRQEVSLLRSRELCDIATDAFFGRAEHPEAYLQAVLEQARIKVAAMTDRCGSLLAENVGSGEYERCRDARGYVVEAIGRLEAMLGEAHCPHAGIS
jgi:hypothetical protein